MIDSLVQTCSPAAGERCKVKHHFYRAYDWLDREFYTTSCGFRVTKEERAFWELTYALHENEYTFECGDDKYICSSCKEELKIPFWLMYIKMHKGPSPSSIIRIYK